MQKLVKELVDLYVSTTCSNCGKQTFQTDIQYKICIDFDTGKTKSSGKASLGVLVCLHCGTVLSMEG